MSDQQDAQLNVRVTKELHDQIKEAAAAQGFRTITEWARVQLSRCAREALAEMRS